MLKSADVSCVKIERAQDDSLPWRSTETIVSDAYTENDDQETSAKATNIPLGVIKIENDVVEPTPDYEQIDLPLEQQQGHLSNTLSHNEVKWPHEQFYGCAERPEETSMKSFLGTACQMLVEASSKTHYKTDVEAFGELLKAELDQIGDADKCQAIRLKIMKVLMSEVD